MIHDKIRAGTLGLLLGSGFMFVWTFILVVSNETHEQYLRRSDIVLRFVVLGMFIALGVMGKICHEQHHRLKKLEARVFGSKNP